MRHTPSYLHRGHETALRGDTINRAFRAVVNAHPDREALVSRTQGLRYTYREFDREIERASRGLIAIGVGAGDRVGIWATDNAEWVVLQMATARIGAILVNVNPAYRVAELEHALKLAEVQYLFLIPSFKSSDYPAMVHELCPEVDHAAPERFRSERFPHLRRLVLYDPDHTMETERPAPGYTVWQEVVTRDGLGLGQAVMRRAAAVDVDDPVNIQFTSGTTGFPKAVVLTHHNLVNNAFFEGEILKFGPGDRLCVPVPFYHCFGMVISNLLCLLRGACLVIPAPHFDAVAVLETIEKERCTAVHGVPTMFAAELDHPDFQLYDLSSLRTGVMAGAPCPPVLMRRVIEDMGCREILIGYGQTEASPVTHSTAPDDSIERRTESVGTNLPHQESKVVDTATGATVPRGTPGEVCFRGYQVMRGYYNDPEATQKAIDEQGWLHSGDLGVMDDDGYLKITGRLTEMIIRGGENVYPAEIEAFYFRHPEVETVAVFGIPDEKMGEEIGAWFKLRRGANVTTEELREYGRDQIAHYKIPRHVWIVDEFPMTVTGKIQKFKIVETVLAEARMATSEASILRR
jgi:fatty-acyl-CoA synthase